MSKHRLSIKNKNSTNFNIYLSFCRLQTLVYRKSPADTNSTGLLKDIA